MPTRRCASPTQIVRCEVPYVMLCGGEPLVVPHFFALAESARASAACSSRSRPTASASMPRSPNGSRACRFGRCRSASTATPRTSTQRQRPGGSLAEGACGVPRGARGRPAAGDHVRADAPQHRTRPSASSSGRAAFGAFRFNTGQPDAHRHRRAALGQARARRAQQYEAFFRTLLERRRRRLMGDMELCYIPFEYARQACEPASRSRRRRCWCCPMAGSRSPPRFRIFAPICVVRRSMQAWDAYRERLAAGCSDEQRYAARAEDESRHAEATSGS